ncbi:MAG TPA: prepilin-type N-terminal cleavage/methylation domain-containing protein [Deltaproteobacteria bacterium]|nr:prepilin-type N-terminal cleavage/methylation domain-containing protein [Deltaproteobacteria bacterium]
MSRHGFTLIELIIVMALIGIMAGIATPLFNSYMKDERLRESVRNLKSDMELAKIRAVRANARVAVTFDTANNRYAIFIDDGAGGGTAGDWVRNGGETEIKTVDLPDDVDMYEVTFGGAARVRFRGVGLPNAAGHCYMRNTNDKYIGIVQTMLGLTRLQESKDSGSTWVDMK